jgi:hypothetical protein
MFLTLATKLLDLIVGLTWRFAERPRPATGADRDLPIGAVRFHCPKCEQAWIAPPSLSRPFVFRCNCNERMVVHVDLLSADQYWRGGRRIRQCDDSRTAASAK